MLARQCNAGLLGMSSYSQLALPVCLTMVRATIDRQIASVTSKMDDFKTDFEKALKVIGDSELPKAEELTKELAKKRDLAIAGSEAVIAKFVSLREKMDDEDAVTVQAIKDVKTNTADAASEFVAEHSPFKVAKFAMDKHLKTAVTFMNKKTKDSLAAAKVSLKASEKSVTVIALEAMETYPAVSKTPNHADDYTSQLYTSSNVYIVLGKHTPLSNNIRLGAFV